MDPSWPINPANPASPLSPLNQPNTDYSSAPTWVLVVSLVCSALLFVACGWVLMGAVSRKL
jgi:hypothetical protein